MPVPNNHGCRHGLFGAAWAARTAHASETSSKLARNLVHTAQAFVVLATGITSQSQRSGLEMCLRGSTWLTLDLSPCGAQGNPRDRVAKLGFAPGPCPSAFGPGLVAPGPDSGAPRPGPGVAGQVSGSTRVGSVASTVLRQLPKRTQELPRWVLLVRASPGTFTTSGWDITDRIRVLWAREFPGTLAK